uniref:uncharacterized protein LOC122581559 n=1 Tax=Erigeron canadensis TaxID=72917 RepID=UPI001CB8AA19|nr:uncharacterized protein LOC122581559 [Erigeron canadensis]
MVKTVGSKSKSWKELQSRRSCRSMHRVHVPKQHNESSLMQDSLAARQNARETGYKIFNNMSVDDKTVISTIFKDKVVDKRVLVEENPKEIRDTMPVDSNKFDEGYQNCSFGNDKDKTKEWSYVHEEQRKQHDHGNKNVLWMDDDQKSQMDLGISEAERTKRLECLMERRSRKLSNFQILRNAMGVGVGNNSSSTISSLHIPKKNPFLSKNLDNMNSPRPGSAPTYLVKNNPFDLPYDPHEEKPILTGDEFEEEFMTTHQKEALLSRHEPSILGDLAPQESTSCENEESFDIDFAYKQLRRLGTSKVGRSICHIVLEDGNKQPQDKILISNVIIDDKHAIAEGESSRKGVDAVNISDENVGTETYTKEEEIRHDVVSSDQSTSSSSSSDDEPILRPNKEAILHCLSMSRMRMILQGKNILRNAESFDCGPSALFEKSKTDGFFFAANKQIHHGSTNSLASDMQVEVSELDSPRSTNISSLDEEGKRSLVNSRYPSEMDLYEARLRDIDEVSEHGFNDPHHLESTIKPDKHNEQGAHYFTEDRRLTEDHKDSCTILKPESSTDQGLSSRFINEVQKSDDRTNVVASLDQQVPDRLPSSQNDKPSHTSTK